MFAPSSAIHSGKETESMKLYYSRGACSLAAHIVVHEAGLSAQIEKVDLKSKTTESGADFTQINPKGYVPVVELDDGQRLTEVGTVLQYLGDRAPASGLVPAAGTMERYRLMEWLNFISSELHKSYSVLFSPDPPEDYKNVVRKRIGARVAYVESQLKNRPYLMGSTFSVADAYLFVALNWSRAMAVDLEPFPAVQQFQQRVAQRPGVQAAMKAEGLIK
jgi:glutathione S-transferase